MICSQVHTCGSWYLLWARENLCCDSLLQFSKGHMAVLLPYFTDFSGWALDIYCAYLSLEENSTKNVLLYLLSSASVQISTVPEKKTLIHQNKFPFFHFLRMSAFLLCNTIIFTDISTLQESQTLQLNLMQVSHLKTLWLVHYTQGFLQLSASEMWKGNIWKGCEWLRQLLEVTSSQEAKLLQITPAEENMKKNLFPCFKGPAKPPISPGSSKNSPHRGR